LVHRQVFGDAIIQTSNFMIFHSGFMQELSTFRDYTPNADAIPDMRKYDEENDSISDIDSDIDQVSQSDVHRTLEM
jgi:hypothetical protein